MLDSMNAFGIQNETYIDTDCLSLSYLHIIISEHMPDMFFLQ